MKSGVRAKTSLFPILSLFILCTIGITYRSVLECSHHHFRPVCNFIYGTSTGRTLASQEKFRSSDFMKPRHWNTFPRNASSWRSDREGKRTDGTITSSETLQGRTTGNDHSKVSTNCSIDKKFMPKGSMAYIALLSVPGSGNTWLRYLIEGVTGIYTGSIYKDPQLIKGGFRGEAENPRNGRVVPVKMHVIKSDESVDGIIYLIRNPYNAIVADYNRLSTHASHIKEATEDDFKTEKWTMFAKWAAWRWQNSIEKYMKIVETRQLVIYYEDMLNGDDLSRQLRRIVSFLNLTLDERRLGCILLKREGNFHRKHHTLTFDPFTDDISAVVERAIRDARQIMNKFGGPPMKPYERYNGTELYGRIEEEIVCPICKRLIQW